ASSVRARLATGCSASSRRRVRVHLIVRSTYKAYARWAAAVVVLFGGACRQAPQEPVAQHDASGSGVSDVAALPAPSDAAVTPKPESADAAAGAAGRAAGGAFCNEVYAADRDRRREKCAASDFAVTQALAQSAATLCFSDLAAALSRSRADFDEAAARQCVA